MTRASSARKWFVAFVSLWAVALVGMWSVRGLQVATSGGTDQSPSPRSSRKPSLSGSGIVIRGSHSFLALTSEEDRIWPAQYIGHGTVMAVSSSCWNNDGCDYHVPSTEFSGDEEDSFMPFQYYSATIAIDNVWYDELGLGSTVVVTRSGPSPYDSDVFANIAEPVTNDREVVIMVVRRAATFLEGDRTFDWLSGLYEVNHDGFLTTDVYQPSTTIGALATRVAAVKAYPPTPTPTNGPSPTPTLTPTPCSGPGC